MHLVNGIITVMQEQAIADTKALVESSTTQMLSGIWNGIVVMQASQISVAFNETFVHTLVSKRDRLISWLSYHHIYNPLITFMGKLVVPRQCFWNPRPMLLFPTMGHCSLWHPFFPCLVFGFPMQAVSPSNLNQIR